METVGEIIGKAMARLGYTQQRLGTETGITAAWINMIVKRGRGPGGAALLKIADVLGIDRKKLVELAHYDRAHDEWKPYLVAPGSEAEPDVLSDEEAARARISGISVIGSASAADGVMPAARRRDGPQATASPGKGDVSGRVGFHPECKAIRVEGDSLEPVAYDGQYVVASPVVRKDDIPDGSIVYVTYVTPGSDEVQAMVKRMYRYRLASEDDAADGRPVYVFTPVNTHLHRVPAAGGSRGRKSSQSSRRPYQTVTVRHRQVREMYMVVGVIFEGPGDS